MYVGFVRNFKQPSEMAYLTAKMSKYYDIDIVYFKPQDVDINNNLINGKILENDHWVEKTLSLPKLIDISPYCFKRKNREIIRHLRKNAYLTDNRKNLINKEKLQNLLKEDEAFSRYVIPSMRLQSINDIVEQINEYGTIVLKPIGGERGKGIFIVKKSGLSYTIGHNKSERKIKKSQLQNFYDNNLNNNYIIQKYVSSRSQQGDPFDCRVHLEKNGSGEWEVARMYIRIGIGQKVISNMNQGGGMANPKQFLKANFPDNWKEIVVSLEELASKFPYKFEELRGTDIMCLGIDVGIDQDGSLYVFEANGSPATVNIRAEVINLRTKYYKYLLENKV